MGYNNKKFKKPTRRFKLKREKKIEYKNISLRIPKGTLDKIDKLAKKSDLSRCKIVEEIVKYAWEFKK